MAEVIDRKLVCDRGDGKEAVTIRISTESVNVEVDLCPEHAEPLMELISLGRPARRRRGRASSLPVEGPKPDPPMPGELPTQNMPVGSPFGDA